MVSEYLKQLHKKYQKGDAREESYYSTLEPLLKNYSEQKRKKKIDVTILPKTTEAGNPDFRIWDGKQDVVGYIEAKDIGKDLDAAEESEQLERYLKTFPNVILTNFTEFRLYRDGKETDRVFIAYHKEITKLHTTPVLHNEDKFFELLSKFFSFSLPRTFTAKTLAVELAKRTKFLKDKIISSEMEAENEEILGFYGAFNTYLIAGLSKDDFADLYSQTITYGLFAARLRAGKNFNRREAIKYIPKTIGILRDVFRFISGADLPLQMETIVDDISAVLAAADAKKILDQYYHEGKGSDPVLHFYETFLAEYDPETREKRGVYYTPDPAVSFIVRSLHIILKEKFNRPLGLADRNVTLLDPAGGTLSFNAKAIQIAVEEFVSNYGEGGKKKFIKEHILENFYAFELMMAPYAIGHMKLSFLLEELGYVMKDDERAKFYLTNTLEMKELEETKLPGMSSLSHESHEAGKVKKNVPILVVHGNPPYSSSNSSGTVFINEIIKDYLIGLGVELERKKGVIQDDYIRFIRYAQWKVLQNTTGILGFITNNSYLDGTIHRSMRFNLYNSFTQIYVLNLHGNSRIKEKSPDGSKDENIFDIQQGISIVFFIKSHSQKKCEVYYQDLYGLRENKYDYLNKNAINTIKWIKLETQEPYYFFKPKDLSQDIIYNKFISIKDIFLFYTSGIETEKDKFAVDFEKSTLKNRLCQLANPKIEMEIVKATYKLANTPNWNMDDARRELQKNGIDDSLFINYCFHAFDYRVTYYSDAIITRTRKTIMTNMLSENLALLTMRQVKGEAFQHAFVTKSISNKFSLSSKSSNVSYHYPLFIYSNINKKDLFSDHESGEKKPNIKSELFEELKSKYTKEVTPEEIFYYIYAVLYSNTYRKKYAEFLKIDFPRIPLTSNYKLFIQLGKLGNQLVDLHLLKSNELDKPILKYSGKGDNKATIKPKWDSGKVYINNSQYFSNVKEEVWNYQIGGYQVCDKWLKDRKGRELSLEEIQTYCKIVTALSRTIEIQKEIDEIYGGVEQ